MHVSRSVLIVFIFWLIHGLYGFVCYGSGLCEISCSVCMLGFFNPMFSSLDWSICSCNWSIGDSVCILGFCNPMEVMLCRWLPCKLGKWFYFFVAMVMSQSWFDWFCYAFPCCCWRLVDLKFMCIQIFLEVAWVRGAISAYWSVFPKQHYHISGLMCTLWKLGILIPMLWFVGGIVNWSLVLHMCHSYFLEDWISFGYAWRLGRLYHVYASISICYGIHSY